MNPQDQITKLNEKAYDEAKKIYPTELDTYKLYAYQGGFKAGYNHRDKEQEDLMKRMAEALREEISPSNNNGMSAFITRTNSLKVLNDYNKRNK